MQRKSASRIARTAGLKFNTAHSITADRGSRVEVSRWDVPARALPEINRIAKAFAMDAQQFLSAWACGELPGQGEDRNRAFLEEGTCLLVKNCNAALKTVAAMAGVTPAEYALTKLNEAIAAEFAGHIVHPKSGMPIAAPSRFERFRELYTRFMPEWDTTNTTAPTACRR